MEVDLSDISKMTNEMDLESSNGQMVIDLKEHGNMEVDMDLEDSLARMENAFNKTGEKLLTPIMLSLCQRSFQKTKTMK